MRSLVEFLKESLYTEIDENASVEAILMFLNRWDGKCVKICDLPSGTDGSKFAKDLADQFNFEDTVIEYCDDCKCVIIKPKDCEDCDNCKEIKYAELFKESLSEDEFKEMYLKVIKDWDGTTYFHHLEEIADDDVKLKKVYGDVQDWERTEHVSTHDALYSLIRRGKV